MQIGQSLQFLSIIYYYYSLEEQMKQISASEVFQKNHFTLFSQKKTKPSFLKRYLIEKENSKKSSNNSSSITANSSPIETPKYVIKSSSHKTLNRSFICQQGLFILLKSTNIPAISQVQKLQKNYKGQFYMEKNAFFDNSLCRNEKNKKKQIQFDLQKYRYEHQKQLVQNKRLYEKRIKQNQRKYLNKYASSQKLNRESFIFFRH